MHAFFLLTGEDPEPLSVSHPRELKAYVSQELDDLISQCTQQESCDRPHLTLSMLPALESLHTEVRNANLNGSLQDQLLQSWKLKSKLKAAVAPEDYRRLQLDGMSNTFRTQTFSYGCSVQLSSCFVF